MLPFSSSEESQQSPHWFAWCTSWASSNDTLASMGNIANIILSFAKASYLPPHTSPLFSSLNTASLQSVVSGNVALLWAARKSAFKASSLSFTFFHFLISLLSMSSRDDSSATGTFSSIVHFSIWGLIIAAKNTFLWSLTLSLASSVISAELPV